MVPLRENGTSILKDSRIISNLRMRVVGKCNWEKINKLENFILGSLKLESSDQSWKVFIAAFSNQKLSNY